jgi:GxxExxY protein
MMHVEELARTAVNAGFELHSEIGPGLLESVYEALLAAALGQKGIKLDRQKPIELRYSGLIFAEGFRADLILEDRLIIEVKSVDQLAPVHGKQLLTYLRLMNLPLGLLMNFGGATFREGVKRVVNQHTDFAPSRLRVNQAALGTRTVAND